MPTMIDFKALPTEYHQYVVELRHEARDYRLQRDAARQALAEVSRHNAALIADLGDCRDQAYGIPAPWMPEAREQHRAARDGGTAVLDYRA